jgi:3-(3-hydroxy-phenyl)propionate hydroxylase
VLLAGDSAHVNNPLGGMGLNGGVHDAVNLAPKLISILQEGGDEALLDQYDRQRRPIAVEYVQQQTIRNKKMIEERDPAVRKKTYDELRAKAADKDQAIAVMLQTSMINAVRKSDALE